MIPIFDKYIQPFLLCLKDGQTKHLSQLRKEIAEYFNLSAEDLDNKTHSGSQKQHHNRVNWAGTYCLWAKLVERPERGNYKITEEGLEFLLKFPEVNMQVLENNCPSYREMKGLAKKSQNNGQSVPAPTNGRVLNDEETPLEKMEESFALMNTALAQELLETIKQKSPQFFEGLVVDLLVKMGYGGEFEGSASVTQYSRDEGIDGIIKEDKLGLNSLYIQAKKWDNTKVGRKEIQSFVGALAGKNATRGVFITTADFSKEAVEYANSINTKVVLMNGTKLCEYMIEYGVGVFTKKTFEIKKIDTDFFEEE